MTPFQSLQIYANATDGQDIRYCCKTENQQIKLLQMTLLYVIFR